MSDDQHDPMTWSGVLDETGARPKPGDPSFNDLPAGLDIPHDFAGEPDPTMSCEDAEAYADTVPLLAPDPDSERP